jgi:mycothiol synthase
VISTGRMPDVTADLPAGWTTRRPTLADVPEILAVVQASDIAAVGEPDVNADEVEETLNAPNFDPAKDSWLGLDETGRVMAWAYIENPSAGPRENIEVYAHPEGGSVAQPHLLDLLLERVAERAGERGVPSLVARAGAIPTEAFYLDLLNSSGFAWLKRYARMRIDLAKDQPLPVLPPDVTIRPVRSEDDADMHTFWSILDTAFKDTPDYTPGTYENFRERLDTTSSFSWDEWFVAEVDGVPAGILQSADIGKDDLDGWVRNLAVAREYRGRQLGRLLLRTAFATYAAKGMLTAGLGVDLTNPTGAYPLYEGVGMRTVYEVDVLERTVVAKP